MGVVYRAKDRRLKRVVAIKVLPPELAFRSEIKTRFLREAETAAQLNHPNIVDIYAVDEAENIVYFVMAYITGDNLAKRLHQQGAMSVDETRRVLRDVADALAYAHERGVIHRDIKPDNILIEAETGRALVSDFGIACGAAETNISDPGSVMGTAQFMSPEQASSEPLDGRSDFYSLGVVAFLALSGRLPFDAPNVPAMLMKQVAAEPPPITTVAPSIPRALAGVIDRCLRKSPSERFAAGEDLAEALEAASAPSRAKIPLALRVWTQAQDPLRPVYLAWSAMFTMGLMSELRRGGDWPIVGAFDLLPLIPITLFHARKTYQALSAGYTLRDLRAALASWQNERREELTFDYEETESGWARLMRRATYALVGGVGFFFFAGVPHTLVGKIVLASVIGGSVLGLTASNVFGVRLIGKTIRPKLIGAVRSLIWNSRVGEWAAKVLTPKHRTTVAELDYRPTEMALSVAASELFAALPASYRAHVPDLPKVVERLEAHAAAARARIDELNAMMSLGGDRSHAAPTNLVAARDAAKQELAEAVASLEAVRLDLLRLHGGAADLRPITTVLEAARELGEQLDRLNDAQQEVHEIARPFAIDLRPHTPV
jgi:eukaryotic-like serine/threonine-protein kinase